MCVTGDVATKEVGHVSHCEDGVSVGAIALSQLLSASVESV
jgi:hypothetical protein